MEHASYENLKCKVVSKGPDDQGSSSTEGSSLYDFVGGAIKKFWSTDPIPIHAGEIKRVVLIQSMQETADESINLSYVEQILMWVAFSLIVFQFLLRIITIFAIKPHKTDALGVYHQTIFAELCVL